MTKNNITSIISSKVVDRTMLMIEQHENIVITTHLSPDGDALGSTLALYHFLKMKNKNVHIIVPNSFPYYLEWLNGADRIINYEHQTEEANQLIKKANLLLSLDYNTPKRIGAMGDVFIKSDAKKILIDHHLDPGDCFDIIISHPAVSSTCELVFRLLYQANKYDIIDKTIAESIYCGMMTDTGGFTFNSNNPETYEIISLLLKKGINKDEIYSNVFHNFKEERLRLLGYILSQRMKIYDEYNAALLWLSKEDQQQFKFVKGDTEGFVNYPLSIKGIIFSVFIREDKDLIKISFRSQGKFPANEFAGKYFNGGGHLNASGGEFHGTIEQAIELFESGIEHYKETLKLNI